MPPMPASFRDLLDALVRTNPGRPVITAYDESTGARVELSATTYVNWVHKTANLLVDELMLDEGDTVRLDLPAHWITTVFVGAALTAGIAITTSDKVDAQLVVGDSSVAPLAGRATLACSLDPFAGRIRSELPRGVDDFGLLWPGQPDALLVLSRPDSSATAWRDSSATLSQSELLEAADGTAGRILTDINPLEEHARTLLSALTAGSLVLVSNASDADWVSRYGAELPDVVLTTGGD